MFCRYCGAAILPDSRFCSRCGKSVAGGFSARTEAVIKRLRLKTPYPYAALFFLLFVAWAIQPAALPFDYSTISMEFELLGETEAPDSNLYRHHLSLIVENVGEEPIGSIPVAIRARAVPNETVEVECDFLGRRLLILQDGTELPLLLHLDDGIDVQEKRRYSIDGLVVAVPPFSVTYEILTEDTEQVLASFTGEVTDSEELSGEQASIPIHGARSPFFGFRQ